MVKAPSSSSPRKTTSTRSRSTATTSSTRKTSTTAKATGTVRASRAETSSSATATKTAVRKVPDDVVVAAPEQPETPTAETGPVEIRKRELIDAVVARSGIRKQFAKPAIETALAILGEALDEGRPLQLPPLGRVKVQKSKEISDGHVLTARIRRKTAEDSDDVDVSDDADEDAESDEEALAAAAE